MAEAAVAVAAVAVAAVAVAALAGCGGEAVVWKEVSYAGPPRPATMAPGSVSPSPDACPISVRTARAGTALFAAWWSVKSDSSGVLRVARSRDGGKSWDAPIVADSSDRSARGCGRPPPAIAADSAKAYVHIAYFAEPASGSGIFFAHSMDGGRTFHEPVPILFGDNPAFVGVAGAGDRVAVAYEDPNSVQPAVGVALSRTMGHIFEDRETVSNENERARQPVVALDSDTVRLWWSDHSADPRISATRTAYREGVWR